MHLPALSRRILAHTLGAATLVIALGTLTTGTASAATPDVGATSGVLGIGPIADSADGCSGSVCIYVTGSGLNVSDWATSAYLSRSMCSTASFLVNGVLWASGGNECGSGGEELVSDWPDPGNFPNGTVLCNTWTGISGKPCETVHS